MRGSIEDAGADVCALAGRGANVILREGARVCPDVDAVRTGGLGGRGALAAP